MATLSTPILWKANPTSRFTSPATFAHVPSVPSTPLHEAWTRANVAGRSLASPFTGCTERKKCARSVWMRLDMAHSTVTFAATASTKSAGRIGRCTARTITSGTLVRTVWFVEGGSASLSPEMFRIPSLSRQIEMMKNNLVISSACDLVHPWIAENRRRRILWACRFKVRYRLFDAKVPVHFPSELVKRAPRFIRGLVQGGAADSVYKLVSNVCIDVFDGVRQALREQQHVPIS